jgi:MFS family permease
MSKLRITTVLCASEVLGMAGFATFPALLPTFLSEWGLSNTEAGWISGIYFAGYAMSVPILSGLTDRMHPRRILLIGAALAGLSSLGYALFADGFWSALGLRLVAGMGLAGTYMPGLKLLSDHTEGPRQSRYVAFYTSSFSIGASTSYFLSGEIATLLDWRWSFGLATAGSVASALLIVTMVPATGARIAEVPRMLLDFRPVLKTRQAMAYVLGYTGHVWELFSMRSWIVTFLAFSQSLQPSETIWNVTLIAAIVNLLGLPSSLGGNELAVRFGRRRTIIIIMIGSFLLSCIIGFAAPLPAPIVIGLCLVYGLTVMADSASLTAGAVAAAPQGHRGATLAVHSTLGSTAAFLGPLAIGTVLDLFGSGTFAWGMAFITMGLGCVMGPVALALLGRSSIEVSQDT